MQVELESGLLEKAWSWVEGLATSLYEDHKKDLLYAAVASACLDRLAQLRPGQLVRFGSGV